MKAKLRNALLRMPLECISTYLKPVPRYKFLIWIPTIWTHYIYVSKAVRIRGYFAKPKGVREQNSLVKSDLKD